MFLKQFHNFISMHRLNMISLKTVTDKMSESELKMTVGGYGYGSDPIVVGGGYTGTCGWTGKSTGGSILVECGAPKGHAIEMASMLVEGRWCCDSCPTTSYCGSGS
jgi:hypothetical protein